MISVSDRKGDLYEILVEARDALQKVDFLIRSGKDRRLPECDPEADGDTWIKRHDRLAEGAVRTTRTVELARTAKGAARTAVVEIRAATFMLKPPHRKLKLGEVSVNVVEVREIAPPADGTEVHWVLLTSLPIKTAEEILRVIVIYSAR